MTDKTLRTVAAGGAVSAGDLFLTRQGADTSDTSITGTQLKTFAQSGLGTAAFVNTGLAAGNVPLNSDLGSAAYETAGTGANQMVQLDGLAKLPAVDGSQLTNIATGATDINGLSDAIAFTTGGFSNNGSYYIGVNSGNLTATGIRNIAVGASSAFNITTADHSTYLGMGAGFADITGSFNTFLGYAADPGASGLTNATALGANAVVAASNTMQFGDSAVTDFYFSNSDGILHGDGSALSNISIDTLTDAKTTADNIFLGSTAASLTTGQFNSSVGIGALSSVAAGSSNVAMGYNALSAVDAGSANTAIGTIAGLTIASGSNNVCIGSGADVSSATSSHRIAIGVNSVCSADNTAQIGDGSLTNLKIGTTLGTLQTGDTTNTSSVPVAIGDFVTAAVTPDATRYIEIMHNGVIVKVIVGS